MKKESGGITSKEAVRKTKKQISLVIMVAAVLIIADLFMSSGNEVKIEDLQGKIYIIRPEEGEESGCLYLNAAVKSEQGLYEKKMSIMVNAYERKKDSNETVKSEEENNGTLQDDQIDYALRSIADNINKDNSVKKVLLPTELETGEQITWDVEEKPNTNTLLIILITVVTTGLLYKERFAAVRKEELRNRGSVIRQLPGFINRLVLLLNAGLVLNNAFQVAVKESICSKEAETDYFYMNLKSIYTSMESTNSSMSSEMKAFARRSGVQELMRVSNIIEDNTNKGTELIHKLKSEGELLWMNRKKRCEELGRMAETRLTLPLILFLMVLIVITIAPALLEL